MRKFTLFFVFLSFIIVSGLIIGNGAKNMVKNSIENRTSSNNSIAKQIGW